MSRKTVVARVKRFRAVFTPEEGWWTVTIPEVPGCHSAGRSLAEATRNIREAIATCVDVFGEAADEIARDAEIERSIDLPPAAEKALGEAKRSREEAERQREKAQQATEQAARRLARAGLSLRDTGELLGLSHQRVKQLLAG